MHIIEIYLQAVLSVLFGLPTPGSNVFRTRLWSVPDTPDYRGINIRLGNVVNTAQMNVREKAVDVLVDLMVRGTEEELEPAILQMDAESHNAIMQSPAIRALSGYMSVRPLQSIEPLTSKEGDQPAAQMTVTYRFILSHARDDVTVSL